MTIRPAISVTLLAVHGVIVIGLGVYFIRIRPALLPEDIRFMETSMGDLVGAVPLITGWLQRVFWVMGGFMISSGMLIVNLALSSFRERSLWSITVAVLAGLSSLGGMVIVNFMIDSDYRWLLLVLALPWIGSLFLVAQGR